LYILNKPPTEKLILQPPEMSDHDLISEQKNKLTNICQRTMALSVGRGMANLNTIQVKMCTATITRARPFLWPLFFAVE
jgi:hypothetical protein